jgi:hypothetical protein
MKARIFLARIIVIASLLMPLLSGTAAAQDADVTKVTDLNRKAIDAYRKGNFEGARSLLKQALDLCASAGLDQHPIKARTHIHLGIVIIEGLNQRELGINQFRKALEIQPDIKLTKGLITPGLESAFEEALVAPAESGAGGEAAAGGEAPAVVAAPDSEPRPAARRKKTDEEGEEEEEEDEDEEGGGSLYLALLVGSGAGIASGAGELDPSHELTASGFAPAQLGHLAPEAGFFLSPKLLLSVQGRFQRVTGVNGFRAPMQGVCGTDNFCSPYQSALAAFARVSYFLSTKSIAPYVGGVLGGGTIRHVKVFPLATNCGPMGGIECVDSLKAGSFFFGGNAGLLIGISKSLFFTVGINALMAAPKFTFHVDGNLGLALKL